MLKVCYCLALFGSPLLNYFLAAVHVIDFYLDEKHSAQKADIVRLVQRDDMQSLELVRGYVREAMSKPSIFFSSMFLDSLAC